MEDGANKNERNPLLFRLPARDDFLPFFSPLVYCFGPGPARRIMLLKLLVVNLTSFH